MTGNKRRIFHHTTMHHWIKPGTHLSSIPRLHQMIVWIIMNSYCLMSLSDEHEIQVIFSLDSLLNLHYF